jgi:hypothetical protein
MKSSPTRLHRVLDVGLRVAGLDAGTLNVAVVLYADCRVNQC